jgi:hypothetical protein
MNPPSSVFQRLILPGFALKAVVIGGGYATGRELATFFLPSGPWGGLYGMLLSMLIWSVVCRFSDSLHSQGRCSWSWALSSCRRSATRVSCACSSM